MRLYLIRHADPDYKNNTITPAGHLEAKALAERMAQIRPDRIYTSPLGRAIDTARYTAEKVGIDPKIEPWTAELDDCALDPELNLGWAMWDIAGHIIRSQRPLPTHDNWFEMACLAKPALRKRFELLKQQSDEFIARHGYERRNGLYHCVKPNREKIAIFCHAGFGLTWLAHVLELPLPLAMIGFFLPTSSVTTILFEERCPEYAVPRCIGVGDTSHLYAAGLPVSRSGMKANAE